MIKSFNLGKKIIINKNIIKAWNNNSEAEKRVCEVEKFVWEAKKLTWEAEMWIWEGNSREANWPKRYTDPNSSQNTYLRESSYLISKLGFVNSIYNFFLICLNCLTKNLLKSFPSRFTGYFKPVILYLTVIYWDLTFSSSKVYI